MTLHKHQWVYLAKGKKRCSYCGRRKNWYIRWDKDQGLAVYGLF